MRSPCLLKTYHTRSALEVQICIALPHQFVLDRQHQLLPDWNIAVSYLILVLQRTLLPLDTSSDRVTREKNRLRVEFIDFGCSLILALQKQGYQSDLFDPRTGYPLLTSRGIIFDDNAVVQAILNYPAISYQHCSLLIHPVWGNNVYPSTIVTSAPLKVVDSCLEQIIDNFSWTLKIDNFM